jgi:RNA polymerase sigma factor (sigma-70 family)
MTEPGHIPDGSDAPSDEDLAVRAVQGDRQALEDLLRRHQRFLYKVALRMLQRPEDAEDATQEALVRIATRLSSFRGESAFRTWAYRIAMNHLLDVRRSRPEEAVTTFACYADYLAHAPEEEPPALGPSPEWQLLVEEAKRSCTLGMLLCLDRGQRLAFILGEILEVGDALGAEVLELSRDNFRQRLSRARQQLDAFLRGQCGLVDPGNPCRCARKTRAFVRDGIVDPARLVFTGVHLTRSERAAAGGDAAVEELAAAIYREHPSYPSPDLAARVRAAAEGGALAALLSGG